MNSLNLSSIEIERYSRHLLLPDFSEQEQQKLKNSSVLIVGAGGLGHPVAQYLAASGVGTITLMDHDTVDLTNLARQILFTEEDLGQPKAAVIIRKLQALNRHVELRGLTEAFSSGNADALCLQHDLIIDCCDNLSAKYTIDAACKRNSKPLIFGAVSRMEGQVSLFHGKAEIGYGDVYPQSSSTAGTGTCETLGVWGASAGIIGSIMASEAMQWLAFGTSALDGRLLQADLKNYSFHSFRLKQRADTAQNVQYNEVIREMDFDEFNAIVKARPDSLVIDLRNQAEHNAFHIGGICVPLEELLVHIHPTAEHQTVMLYCATGMRSYQAALLLAESGFKKMITLRGGIERVR